MASISTSADPARSTFHAAAFGCHWQSDLPLPAFEPLTSPETPPDITVRSCAGAPPPRHTLVSVQRMHHARDGLRLQTDELTADTFHRNAIDVRQGPAWPGHLPSAFFGTVTAALMTWRGGIAMHGSAVEVNGRAILICGASGAGKSTLTASLIATGGRLISDDLSVLQPPASGQPPALFPGRRTLRLFHDVAEMLGRSTAPEQGVTHDEHKSVVVPPRAGTWTPVPLQCVLLLGETAAPDLPLQLRRNRYRRHSFCEIPGHALRTLQLNSLSQKIPLLAMAAVEARSPGAFQELGPRVLDYIAKQAASGFHQGS